MYVDYNMAEIALMICAVSSLSASVGGGLLFIRTKNQDVRAEQKLSKPFYHKLTKQHQPSSCGGEVLYSLQSKSANLSADIKLDDVSSSILSRGEVPSCCLEFENLNLESLSYTLFGETRTKSNIKGDTKQVLNLSETRAITGGEQTACATDISAKFTILE